jgi:hypothetical protein
MKTTIRVEVTEQDIRKGLRGRQDLCAIALAARRILPLRDIIVGCLSIISSSGAFEMDEVGKKFRADFDAGRPVKACKFIATMEGSFF